MQKNLQYIEGSSLKITAKFMIFSVSIFSTKKYMSSFFSTFTSPNDYIMFLRAANGTNWVLSLLKNFVFSVLPQNNSISDIVPRQSRLICCGCGNQGLERQRCRYVYRVLYTSHCFIFNKLQVSIFWNLLFWGFL